MKKSYSELLKHPKWQKKRLEIMQRDNFTCLYCGDKETELHINHLKYTGEPHEAPNIDLETVCKHCHLIFHSENRKILKINKFPIKNNSILCVYNTKEGTNLCEIKDGLVVFITGFLYNSEVLETIKVFNKSLKYQTLPFPKINIINK